MKAAVLYGKEDVRVEEIAPLRLKPVKCEFKSEPRSPAGTDLRFSNAVTTQNDRATGAVRTDWRASFPKSGGAGAEQEVRNGELGTVSWSRILRLRAMFYCRNGQENLCDDLLFLMAHTPNRSGFARARAKNLLRLKTKTDSGAASSNRGVCRAGNRRTPIESRPNVLSSAAGRSA